MKAPNQNPNCKKCGKSFRRYNTIQKYCLDCAISIQQENLLIKGTAFYEKTKKEVKIGNYRNELQKNINLLARMIDASFGFNTCIDCGKPFGKQIDAAHYHDVSTNGGIRFNLHNLHSAKSDCNKYSSSHKVGYNKGLELRYGIDYLNQVEALKSDIKELKLNAVEIVEKLKLVRHIIRNFDKYKFESSLIARNQINELIGIYKK